MSSPLVPEGLRTDQAPPLAILATLETLPPSGVLANVAGLLVAVSGANAVANRLLPGVLAGAHLATLGFLGSIMLGALYQMTPVVAGAPVPFVRLAHAVHAAWISGVAALVWGLLTGTPVFFRVAQGLLGAALIGFLVPLSVALARTPTKSDTVTGMRLAILGLCALGLLGLGLAEARASGHLVGGGDLVAWVTAHAALGGLVWVGGLVTAVSWHVVPMFYLTDPLPAWSRRATLVAVALALVGVPAALATGASPRGVALAALPAARIRACASGSRASPARPSRSRSRSRPPSPTTRAGPWRSAGWCSGAGPASSPTG